MIANPALRKSLAPQYDPPLQGSIGEGAHICDAKPVRSANLQQITTGGLLEQAGDTGKI